MATPPKGYCEVTDMPLREDIEISLEIDKQKYVNDAADEIDSIIGSLYKTPVKYEPMEAEKYRHSILILKKINAHLAAGRLIMAVASPEESTTLDAYGFSLVKNSLDALDKILNRNIILEGAAINSNEPSEYTTSRGYIYNEDKTSSVESFYQIIDPPYFGQTRAGLFRGLW